MNQASNYQTKQLILKWLQQIRKGEKPSSYYPNFILSIERVHGLRIYFDQCISKMILQLLNSVHFQSFSEQSRLKKRQCLFQIANILYVEDYIGKKQYLCIMNQKRVYLVSRIELFLDICQEGQPSIEEIQEIWNSIVDIPFSQFWEICKKYNSLPSILDRVYDKVKGMKGTEDFVTFYLKNNAKFKKQQKNERRQFSQIQIKQKRYKRIDDSQIFLKKSFSAQEYEGFRKRQPTQLNGITRQKTFDYLIQNSQKYRLFQSYIHSVKHNDSRKSNYLLKIVYKQALFFNKQYSPIVSSLHTFINTLITKLRSSRISCFELFGSVRSNLALIEQFDIDISSIPRTQIETIDIETKKKQQAALLFQLRNKLKDKQFAWLSNLFVYNFKNIKVPFLKLTLDSEEMENQFGISLNKVDITIGNQSGAKNSQLISKFMCEPSIAAFCMLIKLWAKRVNIINSQHPMKGLSSYGIALMSLYYLMESKQINFISLCPNFDLDTDVINPNLNNCKLKNLQDNFCGFLQFYRETGEFQKMQKTVCLLSNYKDHCNFEFNHEILFNMCDFIDKTNPGRLRYDQKKVIYSKFETSIKAMKQDIDIIKDLFGDKS